MKPAHELSRSRHEHEIQRAAEAHAPRARKLRALAMRHGTFINEAGGPAGRICASAECGTSIGPHRTLCVRCEQERELHSDPELQRLRTALEYWRAASLSFDRGASLRAAQRYQAAQAQYRARRHALLAAGTGLWVATGARAESGRSAGQHQQIEKVPMKTVRQILLQRFIQSRASSLNQFAMAHGLPYELLRKVVHDGALPKDATLVQYAHSLGLDESTLLLTRTWESARATVKPLLAPVVEQRQRECL
jgi:hypothetical protein